MIDLHCHILPGVDDGAEEIDDSIAMAEAAIRDGTRTVVATPHGSEWAYTGSLAETQQRVSELQAQLGKRAMELELLAGLEAHIAPNLATRYLHGSIYTLNGSRYLLVEFPLQLLPVYTEQALFDLQLHEVVPLIAHPERNLHIGVSPEIIWRLVERGMLVQVTAGSLTGLFGPKIRQVAELLVTHRIAHVIASDAHSAQGRGPGLSAAVRRAADLIGRDAAIAMVTTTPMSILCNETVAVPEPEPLEHHRSWFHFGR